MNIKPIKTKKDHNEVLDRIDFLWDKKDKKSIDELEVLATLVDSYETINFEILPPTPIAAIKFRMEQMGLKNSDIAIFLGGRNRVSEILNNKRNLTVAMIRSLSKGLNIPVESLIG